MSSLLNDDFAPQPPPAGAGSKRRRMEGQPAVESHLTAGIIFFERTLFFKQKRFDAVKKHVEGKVHYASKLTAFKRLFSLDAAREYFTALVQSAVTSFPGAQRGDAAPPRDIFFAISAVCDLLQNSALLKGRCEAAAVTAAIARLLPSTQKFICLDWKALPTAADAAPWGISRDVLVAHMFQIPGVCSAHPGKSLAQLISSRLGQSHTEWAAPMAAVGRPNASLSTPAAVARANVEIIIYNDGARGAAPAACKASLLSARGAATAARAAIEAHEPAYSPQVEVELAISPDVAAEIASWYSARGSDRAAEAAGGVTRILLCDLVSGCNGEVAALRSPVVRARLLLDLVAAGLYKLYAYVAALRDEPTRAKEIPVDTVLRLSPAHLFVFLRNSNHGWGSLAAPGTLHGATLDDVRCGTISLSDLLVNVPSATIATAVTYLTRLVENAKFTAFTDVVSAPATTDATHAVSMWSATGDTSQSYTVKVAETGEVPRRGPLPIPLSAVDPLETLRTCSSATSDAAVGELDWFMSTPATRAMLPSTTVGGFYRSVLFFDIAARASVGVTCNLETDLVEMKKAGADFRTIGRHALSAVEAVPADEA